MNENIVYPAFLVISGIVASTIAIIFLKIFSKRVIKFFEFYPESKGILAVSLKIISWFTSVIIFFIFLRFALKMLNLEFTKNLIDAVIMASPRYILAVVLIFLGFYISRVVRERTKDYTFEFKERMLLVLDLIIHMTFIFSALYSIGINIVFFLELYKVLLWIIGAIVALIVSMTIGIPLGMSIYEKMKVERKSSKKLK